MGPRLVFDTYDDIRDRCDTAPVRQTGSEPGYDHGAIVPGDDWVPLTAEEAERHQADDSMPDSIRIELVRRPLPDCDSDDLAGRLEAAARLDRPSPPSMTSTTARWTSSSTPPPRMTAEVNDRVDLGAALFIRGEPRRTTRQNGSTPLE